MAQRWMDLAQKAEAEPEAGADKREVAPVLIRTAMLRTWIEDVISRLKQLGSCPAFTPSRSPTRQRRHIHGPTVGHPDKQLWVLMHGKDDGKVHFAVMQQVAGV
jgi:hypothetical protein